MVWQSLDKQMSLVYKPSLKKIVAIASQKQLRDGYLAGIPWQWREAKEGETVKLGQWGVLPYAHWILIL